MWRLWLAVGLSFILVDDVLKPMFDRARPFEVLEIQLSTRDPTRRPFLPPMPQWRRPER